MKRLALLTSYFFLFFCNFSTAQPCSLNVASYPYIENFENNDGTWAAFGTSSDWFWGIPGKAVMSSAGEGLKSWFTGGNRFVGYSNGENAWILSPCFDFSSLSNPEISFKVLWETEQRFDGANLQYSLDNGNSWVIVGGLQQNNSCVSVNWYNTNSVTYLGNARGWSGNIQPTSGSCLGGNGSGGWLDARHTLISLAGEPSVRFRFLFGAGTTCNNFDGFGVDDIRIADAAPPNSPLQVETSCINTRTVKFRPLGECIQSAVWNFNDPASGISNTSNDISPTHEFSSPGIYNISLVATNASGVTSTATKEVVIIGAGKQTNWPGACTNAPDATLTILATGSNTPYFYSWDTNPAQSTASISNVSAGTYRVFVSAVNACSLQDSFVLVASTAININPVVKNANCTAANGSITTAVSGGAAPYQYLWSNGFTTSSIGSLSPGNYSLTITDANNCVTSAGPYNIVKDDRALAVSLGNNRNICPGQSITLAPGNFSAYLWQDGSTGPNLLATAPGVYSVTVTDGSGCTGQANVTLTGDCSDIYFPSAFTPNADTRNDLFGPLGNVYNISAYSLNVYDRYGNRVFASSDPFRKWDGTYKSAKPNTGAFVWTSQFTLNGIVQYRKGTVTLLR